MSPNRSTCAHRSRFKSDNWMRRTGPRRRPQPLDRFFRSRRTRRSTTQERYASDGLRPVTRRRNHCAAPSRMSQHSFSRVRSIPSRRRPMHMRWRRSFAKRQVRRGAIRRTHRSRPSRTRPAAQPPLPPRSSTQTASTPGASTASQHRSKLRRFRRHLRRRGQSLRLTHMARSALRATTFELSQSRRDVISDVMWQWGPLGFSGRTARLRGGDFIRSRPHVRATPASISTRFDGPPTRPSQETSSPHRPRSRSPARSS